MQIAGLTLRHIGVIGIRRAPSSPPSKSEGLGFGVWQTIWARCSFPAQILTQTLHVWVVWERLVSSMKLISTIGVYRAQGSRFRTQITASVLAVHPVKAKPCTLNSLGKVWDSGLRFGGRKSGVPTVCSAVFRALGLGFGFELQLGATWDASPVPVTGCYSPPPS